MNESLNMEKQKKQKKQVLSKQHEISGKQQSAGGLMAAGPQQTESKEFTARKREIKAVMQDFATRCNGEWKEKDVRASISMNMPEIRFAISDFANLTADGKRSGAAVELRNCLLEMRAMTQDQTKEPSAEEYTEKLFELSMASEGYCDTHRGRMWTYQGSARIGIAKKVRGMTRDFLSALVTGEEEEKILSNEDADYVTGETLKSITKDLQKAAKAYKKFAARIGNDCQAYTPQEILNRRMQALRLNERKIKLYRMQYPDAAERDAGIQEMIAAYEDGLRWEAVRAFTKKNEKESYLSGLIEKHVEEEGEVEHTEKLSFADQTEGLEPEQLRGIEAIDNWLIRNFQNGGLAGAAITAVKNSHEDFVSALLSLTKRERLHMYYLVETGKRKNPGVVDVGASQSSVYTPDLEAFKDQMLATKWKFWTRITGGYTYMNKLSQAFRKTMEYRREIQSLAALKNEKKELAEKLEKGSNAGTVEQTALLRQSRLIELKGALEEYYRNLKSAEKAKGRMKGAEEAKCREAAEYCQNLMKELVRLDSLLGEAYKGAEDGEDVPDTVSTAASQTATLAGLPNNAIAGLNAANNFFDKPWNLETAGWSKANLWTGGVAGAAGSVANLVGAVTTLIALKDSWAHMSGEERAEKILSITGSAFSAVENGVKIAELVEKGGSLSQYATAGEVTQTAGTVVGAAGSVISGGIAIAKTVGAAKMASHGSHASDYFLKKREGAALEKDLYGDISKEKKRELKYEKNMMLLQQDLTKREAKNAATAWVDAGLSAAGIFVPGLGVVSACFSVVSSIIDSKVVSGIRTRLFDNFFNMDSLVDKAAASKDAQRLLRLPDLKQADRETFKESLRKRVAACAGFCDMSAAAEEICGKFAHLIREKLFGGKAESDEEKNGYIEFVRALNLSYNEQKELPAENILMRKLSAQ